MQERIASDDESMARFFSLLCMGEMILKMTVVGLVAAVADDRERQRYRLMYKLVRADGLGDWAQSLRHLLDGPAVEHLDPATVDERRDLLREAGPGEWQYEAIARLDACLRALKPSQKAADPLPRTVNGYRWATDFAELRNRTRGHGALSSRDSEDLCDDLQASLDSVVRGFSLFRRSWVAVHQDHTGAFHVEHLGGEEPPLEALREDVSREGIYVCFPAPARIDLMRGKSALAANGEHETSDFYFPNGYFGKSTFEMISFLSDDKDLSDAAPYHTPAEKLPDSVTHPDRELTVRGHCFTNLPAAQRDYVLRADLESELKRQLHLDRHEIVTLSGPGGIGKTSLALKVAHDFAEGREKNRFELIVWFSSRDTDLLLDGPKRVQPGVLSLDDFAAEYVRLVGPRDFDRKKSRPKELFSRDLGGNKSPTLFIFDNFETVTKPTELYHWIDTYVRAPNKVLITTRIRDFKGDFPVQVPGMNETECLQLIDAAARSLEIEGLLTPEYRKRLHEEADGHPYVIKVLLGEVAKAEKLVDLERIVAGREEILAALFERTYARFPPATQHAFLTLCSVRAPIPELALEAVLLRSTNARMDAQKAVEELRQCAFLEDVRAGADGEETFIKVPFAAAIFGQQKLTTNAFAAAIEADAELLRFFGADPRLEARQGGVGSFVRRLFENVGERAASGRLAGIEELRPLLEFVSMRHPFGWILLSDLYRREGPTQDYVRAKDALRRYLEKNAPNRTLLASAWKRLAELCKETDDAVGEMHALVSLCEAPGATLSLVSEIARALHRRFSGEDVRPGLKELDPAEKARMFNRVGAVLEANLDGLSATDCSRLALLYVHSAAFKKALEIAERGLKLRPDNAECLRLVAILSQRISQG